MGLSLGRTVVSLSALSVFPSRQQFNFAGGGQNQGFLFVHFRAFDQCAGANLRVQALVQRVGQHFGPFQDALVVPINPPALPELGQASGFDFGLQDQAALGHAALLKARKKASAVGLSLSAVDQTFSSAWASSFVNFFRDTDGRLKRVHLQADAPFRMGPQDLNAIYVRKNTGAMVPFISFASGRWTYGLPKLERDNGVSSFEIQGQGAPGHSTGEAIAVMESLAQKLPAGVGFSWTGISLQQVEAGAQAPILYGLSVLVVFLRLAALYESGSIPVSVIMVSRSSNSRASWRRRGAARPMRQSRLPTSGCARS